MFSRGYYLMPARCGTNLRATQQQPLAEATLCLPPLARRSSAAGRQAGLTAITLLRLRRRVLLSLRRRALLSLGRRAPLLSLGRRMPLLGLRRRARRQISLGRLKLLLKLLLRSLWRPL
jgi:hypothetical protein